MSESASNKTPAPPGLSVRNGPIADDMDIDEPPTNGTSKRKSRSSVGIVNYNDGSDSEDDKPLVCCRLLAIKMT